ncbi:MAG: OmpA family protein [Rhodospirillales bacterium]|jgi:chemotaxis protein MotB|nr:OmpA family protein [Rhodospirillales bacterium]
MIRILLCLITIFPLAFAAAAQDSRAGDSSSDEQFRETQALIERMRAKVKGIDSAAEARDTDIKFLNKKIEEAIGMISSGRETNAELRDANTNFQANLQDFYQKEGELKAKLEEAASEREELESEMEARIASLAERLGEEQRARDGLQGEVSALTARLKETEEGKAEAERRQAEQLEKIESLKGEIATLEEMLNASRQGKADQEARLGDLERRLKAALARKVEVLSGYRSEFFGRLRQVLGGRKDIRMEGDRFVFQSEVLFASGKAAIDPRGRQALTKLARTLNEVARKIPPGLNWILRVDGHTDRLPIRTDHWQSNWELSTARALSVVRFLIEEGIPPRHLAATGFGKFQPLDPRDDEIAYRRNRRIEFKLTQR